MRIVILRHELHDSLARISDPLGRGAQITLRAQGDSLVLIGAQEQRGLSLQVPATVTDQGEQTVTLADLRRVMRRRGRAEETVTLCSRRDGIAVDSELVRSQKPLEAPRIESVASMTLLEQECTLVLQHIAPLCGDTGPTTLVEASGDRLSWCATDLVALATVSGDHPGPGPGRSMLVAPWALQFAAGHGAVHIAEGGPGKASVLRAIGVEAWWVNPEMPYPAWQGLIRPLPYRGSISREVALKAIESAGDVVTLRIEGSTMHLDRRSIPFTRPPRTRKLVECSMKVESQRLRRALEAAPNDEVTFEWGPVFGPLSLVSDSWRALVMPRR